MKKITIVLLAIIALASIGCFTDEEQVKNIRVHGYVRDKLTNDPIPACGIYIMNGYINEVDERATQTDSTGYYEFRRDVWQYYATDISTASDLVHIDQIIEINNKEDNEVNFFLEKY